MLKTPLSPCGGLGPRSLRIDAEDPLGRLERVGKRAVEGERVRTEPMVSNPTRGVESVTFADLLREDDRTAHGERSQYRQVKYRTDWDPRFQPILWGRFLRSGVIISGSLVA
jgi:hypothetical protein